MAPGVAERAAARCEEAADRVAAHRARLGGLARLQCGASTTGVTLGDQLDRKVHGDDGSVTQVLAEHGRVLLEMAAAFRAAGRAAADSDAAGACAVAAAG